MILSLLSLVSGADGDNRSLARLPDKLIGFCSPGLLQPEKAKTEQMLDSCLPSLEGVM